jgi:hypothetical protein
MRSFAPKGHQPHVAGVASAVALAWPPNNAELLKYRGISRKMIG